MKSVIEYVDELKAKMGTTSDGQVSLAIGGARTLVAKWRNEGSLPDDFYCIVMAEMLGIDPLEIIAAANYEREKSEERKGFWLDFMKRHADKVVVVLLICTAISNNTWAGKDLTNQKDSCQELYISRNYANLCACGRSRLHVVLGRATYPCRAPHHPASSLPIDSPRTPMQGVYVQGTF